MKVVNPRNKRARTEDRLKVKKHATSRTITDGFIASNGRHYELSITDQINMIDTYNLLQADPTINTVTWEADGKDMVHTRKEWVGVYIESIRFKRTNITAYRRLKEGALV